MRIRTTVLSRDIGGMLTIVSATSLGPVAVALWYAEWKAAVVFLLSGLLTLAIATGIRLRSAHKSEIGTLAETMISVALIWLLVAALGALPFIAFGESPLDAVFEAMSAWTTTGFSAVDVASMPQSVLFWRSIMQWIGGLGIVVLALGGLFRTSASLYVAESREEQIRPNVLNTVRVMWWIYGLYTILGATALFVAGMSPFDALNHTMTAISTGGMSTHPDGIPGFASPRIEWVLTVIMILGGISFGVHYSLMRGQFRKVLKSVQLRILALALVISSALILLTASDIRAAVFQSVSAMTGTGFNSVGIAALPTGAIAVLIVLMIIGGSAGSTSGGLKIVRVVLMVKSFAWKFSSFLTPLGVPARKLEGRPISSGHLQTVYGFTGLYLLSLTAGALALVFVSGYGISDALFQSASAMGNVGVATVASFGVFEKVLFIFEMWIGRLEIWSVLVLFWSIAHPSVVVTK